MPKGKVIKVILYDGTVNGRVEVNLDGWTGIAYKIDRKNIEAYKNIDELKQSGVYFLYGEEIDKERKIIYHLYIGQAGHRKNGQGILSRIQEHKSKFWTDAIALIDKSNEFGKTEICYLENRFTNIAKNAKGKCPNYVIENGNDPNDGNVIQHKQWALDDFIDGARLIVESLRYDFFLPVVDSSADDLFSKGTDVTPSTNPNEQIEKASLPIMSSNMCDIETKLKVGRVADCAFRYAIENGKFSNEDIAFFQTQEAAKKFKTDGQMALLVEANADSTKIMKWGHRLYYSNSANYCGRSFYICSQIRTHSLIPFVEALVKCGLSIDDIIGLCTKKSVQQIETNERSLTSQPRMEQFRDYLQTTMPKSSANSYFASLKDLSKILIDKKIITESLFECDANVITAVSKFISTDEKFKLVNKKAHCRFSSAFKKYEFFLDIK